ncbi:MAG TPA: 5'-3' exonuclease H3TH domain-containing protein, partial [Dongiaceae bacterium]
MQLVEPRVSLYHTGRNKLYGPLEVTEDFGVPPEKVVDVLALMGDSIDNIPGVPGIGEKGAKALIQEYGSLDELLARAGEITRKAYREGLLENEAQARLSKELTTIHTNLEIPFDPEALHHDPPDTDALRKLFTELEFFSLVEELGPADALGGGGGGGAAGGEEVPAAEEATTPEAWIAATAKLSGEVYLAVLGEEPPLALAAASEEESPAVYADFRRDGM